VRLDTYHCAFVMERSILDWALCIMAILVLLAQPQSYMPYVLHIKICCILNSWLWGVNDQSDIRTSNFLRRYVVLAIIGNKAFFLQVVTKTRHHIQQDRSLRIPSLGIQPRTFEMRTKASDFHKNAILFNHAAVRCYREWSHGPAKSIVLITGRKQ
jgi:hypothetical protein